MRIFALLLLVFGFAQCNYNVNVYNKLAFPITIQTNRNFVLSNVTIPADSQWTMPDLGWGEHSQFEYKNVYMATYSLGAPTETQIEVGYKNQPVNTNVAMLVCLKESCPDLPLTHFMCNYFANPLCYSTITWSYVTSEVVNRPYGTSYSIYFTNRQ